MSGTRKLRRLLPLALLLGGCATSTSTTREAASPAEAARQGKVRIVDLGHPLSEEMPVFPGGVRLKSTTLGTVEHDGYYINEFHIGEHTGTHVDAPAHFIPGAATVDQLPTESLSGFAAVVDITSQVADNPDYEVSVEDVLAWERQHGPLGPQHLVLIRTGWASRWGDEARYRNTDTAGVMHFPGVSVAASQLLRERKVKALGIDTLSTDPGTSATFAQHRDFLGGGGYHIENLGDLSVLPPQGTFVVVAVLPVKGGSGAPARVLAFLEQ
ncbi:MAG TPA: cyclase family protein [Myxococcaceae bacterium]|nr:cyclase family protein [Myxococcaceae bacterium]